MRKYKSYVFTDQDPIVKETLGLLDSSFAETARQSGVAAGTLSNWKKKKTKRPQFCTIAAVGGSVGMKLKWVRSNK